MDCWFSRACSLCLQAAITTDGNSATAHRLEAQPSSMIPSIPQQTFHCLLGLSFLGAQQSLLKVPPQNVLISLSERSIQVHKFESPKVRGLWLRAYVSEFRVDRADHVEDLSQELPPHFWLVQRLKMPTGGGVMIVYFMPSLKKATLNISFHLRFHYPNISPIHPLYIPCITHSTAIYMQRANESNAEILHPGW